MKVKKILSIALIMSCSLLLVACQLAKDDSEYKEAENTVGAFITYELEGEDTQFSDFDKRYYEIGRAHV